jgi:hypothetical protein
MATKPKCCSLGNRGMHSRRESYIIGGIIGTHTYSRRERDLWEGYPFEFVFHLHEYLYNREMVGVVVPAPTNPLLGSFILYVHLHTLLHVFIHYYANV